MAKPNRPPRMTDLTPRAYFDCRALHDSPDWEVLVTWDHALRERISEFVFESEQAASRWIENEAVDWLRRPQDRGRPRIPSAVQQGSKAIPAGRDVVAAAR